MATVAQPLPESAQSGRQELRLEAAEASAPGRTRKRDGAPIVLDASPDAVVRTLEEAEKSGPLK